MERILVSMHGRRGAWEALSRSCSLAKRIDAQLFVLLVLDPTATGRAEREEDMRKRLERTVETAASDGTRIGLFVSSGPYEEEVIRFVGNHGITLLVAENGDGEGRLPEREASLQKIRHRVSCRMELVSPRKQDKSRTHKG